MLSKTGLALLSCLLLGYLGQAQNLSIKGQVHDSATNLPLPFATVVVPAQQTGALAGPDGSFTLSEVRTQPDSLVVMQPGYARQAVALADVSAGALSISLRKMPPTLAGITPHAEPATRLALGAPTTRPGAGLILAVSGTQYALLLTNNKQRKLGIIRSVSFFIGESDFPRTQFRVRLYAVAGADQHPGTDLLTESLVVKATAGGQWFTVDLTAYAITAPAEGFFVAMEWITSCASNYSEGGRTCGQVLRPTFELPENRTWKHVIGQNWQLIPLIKDPKTGKPLNALIKAEVESFK